MSKVGRWSTTPGSNNATPPDGWPEGQAPSTVNDCAREMMASIRTVFQDAQFFDQDMTPTFINATSFSVPGNQTSAIHAGRRLKLYDSVTRYGTVSTASFTTVTTIHVDIDSGGSVTSSLSSFGIGILSVANNSLPRHAYLTLSDVVVTGQLTASDVYALGALNVSGSAIVVGPVRMDSRLNVSATIAAQNVAKAFIRTGLFSAGGCSIINSFNVSSISRSASGVARINFTNAFTDANYVHVITVRHDTLYHPEVWSISTTATSIKFSMRIGGAVNDSQDNFYINAVFFRT